MNSLSESYKSAGVDIEAGYAAVQLMKMHVARTTTPGVLEGIGGFGGMFQPNLSGINTPVFVSGTDGVGTKLKLAFLADKHNTVGIDCVAMCVNDIICTGAKPLFFLDYIACGKNIPDRIAEIVSGVAEGCVQAGTALVGGETAEMPGFYAEDEYDLAGFAVGVVDRDAILNKDNVKDGDYLIALPSSGLHSNGFSLVRKIFDAENTDYSAMPKGFDKPLQEILLTPTKIFVKPILALLEKVKVKSISNITGGGFFENIPRALPEGLAAHVEKANIKTPAIFNLLQEKGSIPERDMFNTFNMGVGMVVTVAKEDVPAALQTLKENGEDAYILGTVKPGSEGVVLC